MTVTECRAIVAGEKLFKLLFSQEPMLVLLLVVMLVLLLVVVLVLVLAFGDRLRLLRFLLQLSLMRNLFSRLHWLRYLLRHL